MKIICSSAPPPPNCRRTALLPCLSELGFTVIEHINPPKMHRLSLVDKTITEKAFDVYRFIHASM